MSAQVQAGQRSFAIEYDNAYIAPTDYNYVAIDQSHQQIFTAWPMLDRIDVLSAVDYHLIQSIRVLSPLSLDISPDGTTLAVGTGSAHILFFNTSNFAKTNDIIFPDSALGVTAFIYTANGNAIVRAIEGLSTGGGITAYWDHTANAFINQSNQGGFFGPYQTNGPLTRSGDYTTIVLGDATSGGVVQFIDGSTGQIAQTISYFSNQIMAVAANKNASRYALCVGLLGIEPTLVILDSSWDEIYQDENGCQGMTFSADGNTLYRDSRPNGVPSIQSIDMTTFAIKTTTNNFVQANTFPTQWQAADNTGMVYGLNADYPNGALFEAVDTTVPSTPPAPSPDDPVQIVHVIDNVGSPQGGDLIRLLCTGVDTAGASSVSVTFGGASGTTVAIEGLLYYVPNFPSLPNLRMVEVKTPPGSPGVVDVTLNVGGTTYTASGAFQFVQTSTIFPFTTSPNFLLYDSLRTKLYAAHQNQVEVIDPITQQVLTPLVPTSGKSPNSQFAGLSLSPDGNRLYIADPGTNLIHVVNLNSQGTGTDINPATAMGSSTPISPARVFETASGRLVGSDMNGRMFLIDPMSDTGGSILDEFGNTISGLPWSSSNKGAYIFICCSGLWDDGASLYTSSRDQVQEVVEASSNDDGTVIAVGGSTPGIALTFPEVLDFSLNTAGLIRNHFDVPMPQGTPSFFLHPSGALLYKAGNIPVSFGLNPFGGSVEIDDLHQFQPAATVAFPEQFITSNSPFTNHMLATDETGRYLFGVTQSGITMMVLNTIPLSIGNLQPDFSQPAGGQTVTIRGSGFQSGAVASFGGAAAATTFVDEDTLTAVVPALSSGLQNVAVTNPNGNSYTAPGILRVTGTSPIPVITGFSPMQLAVQSGIPGFDRPVTVTVVGLGFTPDDIVEIDGQPTDSVFLDASAIQATIPAGFMGQTGSIPFTVVSPYTGPSNLFPLALVNPVPVIQSSAPDSLVVGSSSAGLNVFGTGFVAGSVLQWNGQNLVTSLSGGETNAGQQLVSAAVPGSLLASAGTATITVLNPPPGGGVSNAFAEYVSSPQGEVTFPASIDFGQVLLNTTTTQTVQLINVGSIGYTVNSLAVTPGPFSAHANFCIAANICDLQVQFSPTASGAANGTLTVTDNSAGSPHVILLTGIGTQTLTPVVTLTSIDSLDQTITATLEGTAVVGGAGVPGTAWIEYGTDQTLGTYAQSLPWSFVGNNSISGSLVGLNPATVYAARLAVHTVGGTGRSAVHLFATLAASPLVRIAIANGASGLATVSAGQAATYHLVAWDGGNGYTGIATLSCSGAGVASGTTCSVTPSTVSVGVNTTPFTVTITTTARSMGSTGNIFNDFVFAFGLLLATRTFAFGRRRPGVSPVICIALLAVFALACGGSGSSSNSGEATIQPSGTPSGSYLLVVNASTGGFQTSELLTLNVN